MVKIPVTRDSVRRQSIFAITIFLIIRFHERKVAQFVDGALTNELRRIAQW